MGRPLVGLCQPLWYRGPDYYRIPWRQQWSGSAGGVAATMGVHLTDLFLWLMGDWRQVEAIAATLNSPAEVEDVAMALVQFENGAFGSISSSSISPRQETYMRLDFEQATVDVYGVYGYSNANWRFAIADKATHTTALERWRNIEEDVASSHKVQVAELLDSMDRGERPFVSGLEARRILEFLASMYKSGITRQIVERGSIGPDDPFYRAMNGFRNGKDTIGYCSL
jgi:predicted dehydrogenase